MKKILLSLMSIGLVAIVAVFVTTAYFSDTETSEDNTFVAGAIDLLVDNESYAIDWNIPGYNETKTGAFVKSDHTSWDLEDLTVHKFFDFIDLKPGDYGEDTISVHVNTNDAWVCAAARITDDNDVDYSEPELDDDLTQGDPTTTDGELDEEVNFAFWIDDGDNVYEQGEQIFLQGPLSGLGESGKIGLADYPGQPLLAESTMYIGKYWCFGNMEPNGTPQDQSGESDPLQRGTTGFTCDGASVNNAAQTDMVVGDLQFYAVQHRNNPEFSCDSWTPTWPEEERPLVGTDLGKYPNPTCTTTVGVGQTITTVQGGVNAALPNETVCVADGSYDETVVIDKALTLASVNGPTNTATITGGVNIKSSDVTLTGFIINPGTILGENVAVYLDGGLSNLVVSYNDLNGLDESPSRGVVTVTNGVYTNVEVVNNIIHDFSSGIYTNPGTSSIVVKYNDIYDNSAGIGGYTGAHVIYNEFSGAAGEAMGTDASYDGTSVVEHNNFRTGLDLNSYAGPTVIAENNWWEEGGVNQILGSVDYTPETGSAYPHN